MLEEDSKPSRDYHHGILEKLRAADFANAVFWDEISRSAWIRILNLGFK
jgi:hypothetical protein